jgi:E3 SUMO-protein ligase PIAS1
MALQKLADCIKARESTRDTARLNIDLPPDVADLLNRDSNYRVMVFCAADVASSTPTDIAFPHQVELKCNSNDVKANLRGLKNKPGSTRPTDITSFIKKKIAGYQNVLEMVYALTNKVSDPIHTQAYYYLLRVPFLSIRTSMLNRPNLRCRSTS